MLNTTVPHLFSPFQLNTQIRATKSMCNTIRFSAGSGAELHAMAYLGFQNGGTFSLGTSVRAKGEGNQVYQYLSNVKEAYPMPLLNTPLAPCKR